MLEELKRRAAADPQNATLALNVVAAMARGNRGGELLEVLKDREGWNKASEGSQYLAGLEVARRLGLDWEFKGMRVWECENVTDTPEDEELRDEDHLDRDSGWERRKTIRHRLALYTHKPTGMEFSLLPGFSKAFDNDYVVLTSDRDRYGREREPTSLPNGCSGSRPIEMRTREGGRVTRQVHFHDHKCKNHVEPFLIARWPMTRKYFKPAKDYEDLPVVGIGFEDAVSILKKLGLSLPTPDQWEYACRAGSSTRFYWGDEFDESYVWHGGNSGAVHPGESPSFDPSLVNRNEFDIYEQPRPHSPKEHEGKHNAFGLVDMIGNVWEWCDNASGKGGSYLSGDPFSDSLEMSQTGMFVPYEESSENLRTIGFRPVAAVPGLE